MCELEYRIHTIGLLVTYQCNLRCRYCYIPEKSKKKMSLKTAQHILEPFLRQSGEPLEIVLMGAEPLTAWPMIRQLVEWVENMEKKRPVHFFGSTNGTLMTELMKEWFIVHRDIICLGLSYDGLPSTQDHNRSGSSANINYLLFHELWPEQTFQMTINEESVGDMAQGVIFLLEQGIRVNANVAYETTEWSNRALKIYARQLSILSEYYETHPNAYRIHQFDHPLLKYARDLRKPPKQLHQCGCGEGFAVFDLDGRVYPCHILSPLVLDNEKLKTLPPITEKTDFEDSRCRGCAFVSDCPTCAGCNYLYREEYRRRDITHCKLMQLEVLADIHLISRKMMKKSSLSKDDMMIIQGIQELVNWMITKRKL